MSLNSEVNRMETTIYFQDVRLNGFVDLPVNPAGIVLFAHGSGSGRLSPRNNFVARELQKANYATLLFDLLSEEESKDRALVFDIPLLATRMRAVYDWMRKQSGLEPIPAGFFGASTGAAAAIEAAARIGPEIKAVVSRGGRPDLAADYLTMLKSPTLLIVGERDSDVADLNRAAMAKMDVEKDIVLVKGATHLFEEAGALEEVTRYATEWFDRFLKTPASMTRPEGLHYGYDIFPVDMIKSE